MQYALATHNLYGKEVGNNIFFSFLNVNVPDSSKIH